MALEYFSEYANVSQGYGDGLLLCKIMLGKTYKMNSIEFTQTTNYELYGDLLVVCIYGDLLCKDFYNRYKFQIQQDMLCDAA